MRAFVQVDAFTDQPFHGNPAVVIKPGPWFDDSVMQAIAAEMAVSETTFLSGADGRYDLRWFTPEAEVDLCGHATLAAAHALWSEWGERHGVLSFSTKSGLLVVTRDPSDRVLIWMDFPAEPVVELSTESDDAMALTEILGVDPVFVGRNRMDNLIEVGSTSIVEKLEPDFAALRRIDTRGVIVTAKSRAAGSADFVSRFFAPAIGIDEDPVTGSAHCALAPFWSERLGKSEMTGFQASNRTGFVRVRVTGDRVKLGGSAVTVFSGELRNLG